MTFIEVHINEDLSELEKAIRDVCESYFPDDVPEKYLPGIRFGRVIVWQGRMFQQVDIPLAYEDRIFNDAWRLRPGRARIQVGSIRGKVFTTPPQAGDEPAARIVEGGRCGQSYVVRPFHYSDYDREERRNDRLHD